MPPKKRGIEEVIDLTGDDENLYTATNSKSARKQMGVPPSARHRAPLSSSQASSSSAAPQFSSQSAYHGQPGSRVYSQPSSSWARPSSSWAQPSSQERDSWLADEEDCGLASIDLTQCESESDLATYELYGTLDVSIVGTRYYNGLVSPGEVVLCKRESGNPYDSNAVRIDNVLGAQVGHLPRKVVEKLVPYIDAKDIRIEGMITGEKGMFDCPARLYLFGTSDPQARATLEQRLKADKLVKATQLKQTKAEAERHKIATGLKGVTTSHGLPSTDTLDSLLANSEVVNMDMNTDALKNWALSEEKLAQLPMADQPEALASQLLPYQLQGLAWMTAKEKPVFADGQANASVQLWKRSSQGHYDNIATHIRTKTPPKLMSGGILADDMGLGKTLQIISLILTGGSGPTLIVAPLSVMSNWEQQIERHVKKELNVRVLRYHGTKLPNIGTKGFADWDVVITTYNKMAENIAEGRTSALRAQKWRRVVLDEGHTIRNHRTQVARAAYQLKAESRWVVTGTPIINDVKDLQSLLQFLHLTGGLEDPSVFNGQIARPLDRQEVGAQLLVRLLMEDICLRRKKTMSFVNLKLPAKTEYVHKITFRPEEKSRYDALRADVRDELVMSNKTINFSHVLVRLLRLRQACNHWTLCRESVADVLKDLDGKDVIPLNEENRKILQKALQLYIDNQEECPVCLDALKGPVITHCKHVFCRPCISTVINTQHKCPLCRNELKEESFVGPAQESSGQEMEDFDMESKSSKTEALMHILRVAFKNPESKVVVFSQWTSFLNILQKQMDDAGHKATRLDGSMNASKRDAALEQFEKDPDSRVLLASLGVCSVGLNLVSADTVILADSWWAPAIEDQAVDRVHRLGQTRPVTIWRLVMEDSIEEGVLEIQARKRKLVGKAFQEKDKGKKSQETRMKDIMQLLDVSMSD